MLAKNSKHYIAPVAEMLKIDRELAEDVISFYYSQVYKKLDKLDTTFLQVEELGSFTPNHKRIKHYILKNEALLEKLNAKSDKETSLKVEVKRRLQELYNLHNKLCAIYEARIEHRKNKLENGHLEEPKSYFRRNS